jgi:hypothetical protein
MLEPIETERSTSTYPFTHQELLRLAAYKAAIEAGFYNEGKEPTPIARCDHSPK